MASKIDRFLASPAFAVAGASTDRRKYGNKCLRCYLQNGREVIPINPNEPEVEGLATVASARELPDRVEAISIVTPPAVTERIVDDAIARGIKHLWMQPGAESPRAVERAEAAGINVIADGSCLLVILGFCDR